MILVRMCDNHVLKVAKIKVVFYTVCVRLRTKVYEQVVVDKNLRACAKLSPLLLSCKTAGLAVTEYAGNSL